MLTCGACPASTGKGKVGRSSARTKANDPFASVVSISAIRSRVPTPGKDASFATVSGENLASIDPKSVNRVVVSTRRPFACA